MAGRPLANLTHIVAELSFPPGNHLTLIKGGKGGQRREKGWQCFHPGKKLSGEMRRTAGVILPSVGSGRERSFVGKTERTKNKRSTVVRFEKGVRR